MTFRILKDKHEFVPQFKKQTSDPWQTFTGAHWFGFPLRLAFRTEAEAREFLDTESGKNDKIIPYP